MGTSNVWAGSCNWCGRCGCLSQPLADIDWGPGLPEGLFDWGRQHPDEEIELVSAIKKAVNWQRGDVEYSFTIAVGQEQVNGYVSERGIQVSISDRSCAFYDKLSKGCKLWGTALLPPICANTPNNKNDGWNKVSADKWWDNHKAYCTFNLVKNG